ncbi:MAG: HAMP domain-containing protein [Candidatus Hydrogenedentes bacterium]|nr:HAMP domain-containing protein [Candidatus Hydrogenedentota bacterium]
MKKTSRPSASLAFRLALSLAAVVGACLAVTFVAVYALMVSNAHRRVDEQLRHEVSEVASLLSPQGVEALEGPLARLAQAEGTDLVCYRVMDRVGAVLAKTDTASWQWLTINRQALAAATREQPYYESVLRNTKEGEARVIYAVLSDDRILQVAIRTFHELEPLRDLRHRFLVIGAFGVCLAIGVGWIVAKRALVPLEAVTDTALTIAEGHFEARMKPESRDIELERLAGAFNAMLDRIQSFVRELRDLNDSLAHDLRTVLARIHLAAERLLSSRPIAEEQESLAVSIVEESADLLGTLNTIMDLSEINTGVAQTQFSSVDVTALMVELCEFFEVTATEKGIALEFDSTDHAVISGDPNRLRRALANIVDNAVKYTSRSGKILVKVRSENEVVAVSVEDSGVGIPEEALPYIFERFYRADKSRSREGHGLGLSLAAAIVNLHGGNIQVQSEEGKGSAFTISFPRPPSTLG